MDKEIFVFLTADGDGNVLTVDASRYSGRFDSKTNAVTAITDEKEYSFAKSSQKMPNIEEPCSVRFTLKNGKAQSITHIDELTKNPIAPAKHLGELLLSETVYTEEFPNLKEWNGFSPRTFSFRKIYVLALSIVRKACSIITVFSNTTFLHRLNNAKALLWNNP